MKAEISADADRLLRHLIDNYWVSVQHVIEMGYSGAATELIAAGYAARSDMDGVPAVVFWREAKS